MLKTKLGQLWIGGLLAAVRGRDFWEFLDVLSAEHPGSSQWWQAFADINRHRGIGIGTRGVVDNDRSVLSMCPIGPFRGRQADFSHRHADIGLSTGYVNLARRGERGGRQWRRRNGDSVVFHGTVCIGLDAHRELLSS